MKIGWDLDGCLAQQDVIQVCQTRNLPELKAMYYGCLLPNTNPQLYANEDDEIVIITGREESLRDITETWCKRWFPQYKLIMAPTLPWKDESEWQVWFERVAENKAKQINELKLDIYFEDMPETVKALRKLCPNCKIIQFGGRIK
jgi:hypothetical protein